MRLIGESQMINNSAQSTLAKLLAKENITVQHGNFKTAFFDVEKRVLGLPIWKKTNKDVYDLFVGHEVGHALYTPSEGWHNSKDTIGNLPRAYLNVIEDIRIEKHIQTKYPGLIGSFKRAYNELNKENFFDLNNRDIDSLGLMDRINIKAKLRDLVSVKFSNEEQPYVDQAFAVETWDDVLESCRALYDFLEKNKNKNDVFENQEKMIVSNQFGDSFDDQTEELDEIDSNEPSSNDMQNNFDINQDQKNNKNDFRSKQQSTEESNNTNNSDKSESNDSTHNVITDNAFRSKEEQLIEMNHGYQPRYINGVTRFQANNMIIGIDELFKSRDEYNTYMNSHAQANGYEIYRSTEIEKMNDDYVKFNDTNKKFTNLLAKEFEMRKAAYQYSRAQTSRSGTLNVNKLYSYKYNDDIFKKITRLGDAKSHGLVMFIDYSGSMSNVIGDVIRQTLILATFCKKVNIPFDVYSFTDGRDITQEEYDIYASNSLKYASVDTSRVKCMHLLSSSFNKEQYSRAYYDLFKQSFNQIRYGSKFESMNATPLNECIMASEFIVEDFQQKHGIQKATVLFLTDGDASSMYVNKSQTEIPTSGYVINMNGVMIRVKNDRELTSFLLENLRKKFNVIGYFLCSNTSEFTSRMYKGGIYKYNDEYTEARKNFLRNKFATLDNKLGYDRFFIIKADSKSLSVDDDEFEVEKFASKGDIVKAFKKHANSKKINKLFATQFAEIIS